MLLAALCLPLKSARAATVTLAPVADTTLIETAPNNNNGSQTFFNSGTTQNNTRTRGLVQFDFTSQIPANSLVIAVDLVINVVKQPADGYAASTFDLHTVLVPWGEGNKIAANPANPGQGAPASAGEATWNSRMQGIATWSAPGGAAGVDFAAAVSASQTVYNSASSPYTFASTPGLVADVQTWVNNPQNNHGWILISEAENTTFTARRFGSREDPLNGPQLIVQFSPVPEPAMLWVVACGVGLALSRRNLQRSRGGADGSSVR